RSSWRPGALQSQLWVSRAADDEIHAVRRRAARSGTHAGEPCVQDGGGVGGCAVHAVADEPVVEQTVHDRDQVDGALTAVRDAEVVEQFTGLVRDGLADGRVCGEQRVELWI